MGKNSTHWADDIAKKILERGKKHVVATGITPSGNIHIGNMREVVTADAVYKALSDTDTDTDSRLIYIADTYDPLRKVYPFLPDDYDQYVGWPLSEIPDPDGCCPGYVDHFLNPFLKSLDNLNIKVEVFKADEMYKNGDYNEAIKIALPRRDEISEIIDRISGKSSYSSNWNPFNPICESCGRITSAKVIGYDLDEETVEYSCSCGHSGVASIQGGGKLTWRVDWAARWAILGVTVEPFGKDHAVAGSSYDTGVELSKKIFNYDPPYPIPFEHILLKGKGKMSSSSGVTISIEQMLDILPSEVLRYLIIRTKPEKHIDFDPGIPLITLIDEFDGLLEDDRLRELSQTKSSSVFFARIPFGHIVNAFQIARGDFTQILTVLKRSGYDVSEEEMIKLRSEKAGKWLETFAPNSVKFSLQKKIPDGVKNLSSEQKKALLHLSGYMDGKSGEEIHDEIYKISEELNIKPNSIFKAIYMALLGLKSGPRAGWFLSSLDQTFVKERFIEASDR